MGSNFIGQVILGRYRVDAFVEAGGMGAVYRIWDLTRSVPLAMKVLHDDLGEDPSAWKMFQREADALMRLAHPNIVPFYGLFQTGEFAFFLEHFVDGASLKHLLRSRKGAPLPINDALIYLKALSAALGYAHYNGIVHCDIKPGNVLLDHGGNIYLTDFGIARHASSTTTTAAHAGTPAYMAPEQIRGDPVTPATDVYSLAVMLYEMVTGRRPFTGSEPESEPYGATDQRIFYAHLNLLPPHPSWVNPAVPEGLAQVILAAMAKNPAERYASTMDFFLAACQGAGIFPDSLPVHVTPDSRFQTEAFSRPPADQPSWPPQPAYQPVVFPATVTMDQLSPQPYSYPPPQPTQALRGSWLRSNLRAILIAGGAVVAFGAFLIVLINALGNKPAVVSPTSVSPAQSTRPAASSPTRAWTSAPLDTPAGQSTAPVVPPPADPTRAFTATPAFTPTARFTFTWTPTPGKGEFNRAAYIPLPGVPECQTVHSHLKVNDWALITYGGTDHNAVRSTPDTHPTDNRIGDVQRGELMLVTEGPVCNYGWLLWKVHAASGLVGWTPETDGKDFWIEPFPSREACPGARPSLLQKGDSAQVTLFPATPNTVRSEPSTTAGRVFSAPAGTILTVLDGPKCNGGYVWWNIQMPDGATGWTAEGDSSTYFLVPVPKPHR